jgi:PAS domain S-box-containing protein
MTDDTIILDRHTYEAWQRELQELRQAVKILTESTDTGAKEAAKAVTKIVTPEKKAETKLNHLHVHLESIIAERADDLIETEHKQAEQERQILISLIENSSDFIGIADMTGKPIFVNKAGLKLVGLESLESLKGLHINDFLPPKEQALHNEYILPVFRDTGIWRGEFCFRHFQTGESIPVDYNSFLIKHHQTGEPLGLATITRDIRQRKQVDAKLQEQEQFLRSIFEGCGQIIFVVDIVENGEFRYSGWNSLAVELTGINQSQIIGKTPKDVFGPVEGDLVYQNYKNCLKAGRSITYEECLTFKGELTWWLTILNPLRKDGGQIFRLVGTTLNITEHKNALEALKASQHFVESISDSSPNILYIYDLEEQRNVYTNREITTVLGYPQTEIQQMKPLDIRKLIHPQDRIKLKDRLDKFATAKDGEIFEFEFRVKQANGEWFWLYSRETVFSRNADGKVKQILCVATDITQRKADEDKLQQQTKNLQEALKNLQATQVQLIQSEKMSSIGNMVAGIAHEINNPINFIHGNLIPASEYIRDLMDIIALYQVYFPDPPVAIQEKIAEVELDFVTEDLNKIIQSMSVGTERIREIVLSLRNFSRLDEAECKQANIHDGIDNTLMILQNRLKSKPSHPEIFVIKDYGNIPLIDCYPGQLNQVFMNILSNAIDVLENPSLGRSGEIHITTEILKQDYITIRISDNGSGIHPEHISKLFDPFFTTKEIGKGTGLGLSISYQIVVEKHRGKLYCDSTPGVGTQFVIEIPITQPEALL